MTCGRWWSGHAAAQTRFTSIQMTPAPAAFVTLAVDAGKAAAASVFSAASPRSGPAASRFSHPPDAEPDDVSDLIALVGLGGGFGERLMATVAADWTTPLREGRPEVAEALPRLHAALYGRVFRGAAQLARGVSGESTDGSCWQLATVAPDLRSTERIEPRIRAAADA
jgi:hypothetical protein